MAKSKAQDEAANSDVEKNELMPNEEPQTVAVSGESNIYVYIGPNLPGAMLKNNTILKGTLEKIKGYYEELLANHPEIKYEMVQRLIVPLSRLAKSRENIEKPGNILHKYYSDLTAEILKVRERLHGNGGNK